MNSKTLQEKWRDLMAAKLANVKSLKQIEKMDLNVEKIMENLRDLYKNKLDVIDEHKLLQYGGQLLGYYASIGVTCSLKRAERDAAEQSYDELFASMTTMNKVGDVGVTEARAIAKEQMGEFGSEIIWREQEKNAYEAIVEVTDKTISFIQSAIKIKNSERIGQGKLGNEGYENSNAKIY